MGNQPSSKTFPVPIWSTWSKVQPVGFANQGDRSIVQDMAIDILAVPLDSVSPSRSSLEPERQNPVKNRRPRETIDLYVYLSYRNWDLARKQIETERGLDYVSPNRRFSVLHVAVENNAPVDIVRLLISKDLDVNMTESLFNQTPLHVLMKVLNERSSFETLKYLLDAGANVNARAKYGRTPLYCALKHRLHRRFIEELLKAGAVIGPEELILAKEKCTEMVVQLLECVKIMSILCSVRLRFINYRQQHCVVVNMDGCDGENFSSAVPEASYIQSKKFGYGVAQVPIEILREIKSYVFGY